jgi:HEAT repeat protein
MITCKGGIMNHKLNLIGLTVALVAIGQLSAAPPPAGKPNAVRPLLEARGDRNSDRRLAVVGTLGKRLSADEIQALCQYVVAPQTADQPGSPDRRGEHVVRNNILNVLRNQKTPPAGLADPLISIYQDRRQDAVMRDYAVQHLHSWYAQATAAERGRMHSVFWNALRETDSSIAGTALLALHHLAEEHPEINSAQVNQAALRLARDERCGDLSRTTAIQVCGQRGVGEVSPTAVTLAESSTNLTLRIAAIATLGNLGDGKAKAALQTLSKSDDPSVRRASETALQRVNQRHNVQGEVHQ